MKPSKKTINTLVILGMMAALFVSVYPAGVSATPWKSDVNTLHQNQYLAAFVKGTGSDNGSDAYNKGTNEPGDDSAKAGNTDSGDVQNGSDTGSNGSDGANGTDQGTGTDADGNASNGSSDGGSGTDGDVSGTGTSDNGDAQSGDTKSDDTKSGDADSDDYESEIGAPVLDGENSVSNSAKNDKTDGSDGAADDPGKGPTRGVAASGNVSGATGWIWEVNTIDGSSGKYELTFRYTGTAATPPTFTIPGSFISNIASALSSAGLTKDSIASLVIPERCTEIGTYAFQNMDGLETAEFPSTLKTINSYAFGDATTSDTADVPNGCGKLRTVIIKENADGKSELEYVGNRAFNGCKALTSIRTENGTSLENTNLRYIGAAAFMNVAVEEFKIPDQIAKGNNSSSYYIGTYAFARNNRLKKVDMPALYYTYNTKNYLFSNCPALEEVSFRPVTGASNTGSHDYSQLPNYIFQNDTHLKRIDLSPWENSTKSSYFYLYDTTFTGTSLNDLEEIILPKNKSVSIQTSTFKNKTGITSWSQFTNRDYITSIESQAFYGTRLTSGDMSSLTRLTTIGSEAFRDCEKMVDLVIPEAVTSIGSAAFKNCDNLESVTINARQLTSVTTSNLFHGDDNLKTVTISSNTKSLNGNVLASIPEGVEVLFEGENIINITKATANGGMKPLRSLDGRIYVDPQGVLYKLNDDNSASLVYVPPVYMDEGVKKPLTSYTVPETINAGGTEYTIKGVEHYAVNLAKNLTALTFEKPENIYLKASAFTGWTTSSDNKGKTINGKEYIDVNDWAKVSQICDFPIGEDSTGRAQLVQVIEDTFKDEDGKDVLKVIVAMKDKSPSADDTYDYKTGQPATYTIAISNEDNTTLNKVVRVYFSFSDKGYNLGTFTEGDHVVVNSNGSRYPLKVVQTDNPDVYYYEVTGINAGETLAFQNDLFYPSPSTSGGSVKIWTHTITPEEAEAKEGQVINPEKYMQLDWGTTPVVFKYAKTNAQVYNADLRKLQDPIILTNSDGEAYVSGMAWRVTESNTGSSSTTEGLDFIRWVNYEDVITLPEELYWRDGIREAIQQGNWDVENVSSYYDYNSDSTLACKAITVTVGGKKYYLAYLGVRNGYGRDNIDNLKVNVTDDNKVRLSWKVSNSSLSNASATNEYTAHSFFLKVGDSVLLADLDKVNDLIDNEKQLHPDAPRPLKELLKVNNQTHEVRHYSYSPNQEATASAATPIDANYDVQIRKDYQTNNNSYVSVSGGKNEFFNLTINNTGILNLDTWGERVSETDDQGNTTYRYNGSIAYDKLSNYLYIEPANIERMFAERVTLGTGSNAQTVNLGDWLSITIDKPSLFTPNQFQPMDGVDQTNKYTTGSSSNISYTNDNSAQLDDQNARMIERNNTSIRFTRTTGGILAELRLNPEDPSEVVTKVIGTTGDYPSVDALFKAIGYMPTNGTTYTVRYNLTGDQTFTLKAGQKLVIPIRSSYKTTPMLLTADTRNSYPSSRVTVQNSAKVSLKLNETPISRTVTPIYYHYWSRELFMSKYGYLTGQNSALTSTSLVNDKSVIDGVLSFYNNSGKAYEHIKLRDYMDGPQIALAPVSQNPDLKGPNGETLDKYTVSNVEYWVLNHIGTYNNVKFGSTSGRNSTQNLTATIVVSENVSGGKRTSLNTLFKWDPDQNSVYRNWGSTSTTSYIYYKVLVDATQAGMVSAADPGEVQQFHLNNKAWLGDHQGHRLWDVMGVDSQVYGFSKHIVTGKGKQDATDTVQNGGLIRASRVQQNETVTYQVQINNLTDAPAVLKGNRIRDLLPATYGTFDWEKGRNVTNLRFFGSDGIQIKYGTGDQQVDIPVNAIGMEDAATAAVSDDHWSISKGGTATSPTYNIVWDNNFSVEYPKNGKLFILVDLTFPTRPDDGASEWDQYVAANAGRILENTFYLDGRWSSVEHLLESEGKAVLFKGVMDTGITTRAENNTNTSRIRYQTNNSRLVYQNGTGTPDETKYTDQDLKASTITYYTVIYNGSYDRMYLSDLQDQLPRGFWLQSMCNTTESSTWTDYDGNYTPTGDTVYQSHNWIGYGCYGNTIATDTISEGRSGAANKLVTIDNSGDQFDNNTVKYVNARVRSATTTGADGRQHITFTIMGHPSNANYSDGIIKYDDEVKKYFLNPGEAVRFGYNVQIDKYANTDEIATNTITMPYYDYAGTGFQNAFDLGTVQKAKATSGITPNDGGCEMMTAAQVAEKYGVDTSKYTAPQYSTLNTGNYMVSGVTVHRAPMTPGLQKTLAGTTARAMNPSATTIEGSQGSASALYGTAYAGGAKTNHIINWRLRVFNEATGTGKNDDAGGLMENYSVVDTVDSPYAFTGQVFYNIYRANSSSGTRIGSSQYLFTIGSRKVWAVDQTPGAEMVRLSTGSSLSASGNRQVRIGDAEDDSDDDWFQFGTGLKSGRVKLEKTDEGKEVMTIELTGSGYSIPAGYWNDFCVHTMYAVDEVVISEPKYNDAVLYPDQDYESDKVVQGKARTKEERDEHGELITVNDGVQSGASLMLTQGYTTSSYKSITEIGNTSNTGRSDDSNNCITLSEKKKTFRYDLRVTGPQGVMSKIVIIDDLPHVGDHSAFVEADARESAFHVGFLDSNLNLTLSTAKKGQTAETTIPPQYYTVYVSTKTSFTKDDWNGVESADWTKLTDAGRSDADKAALKTARSIRVIIDDPSAWAKDATKYLMASECKIHIAFNAKIDDSKTTVASEKAQPGKIAWNSFGYHYTVPQTQNGTEANSYGISLEAQPLNVGIKYPAAPLLTKKLTEEVTVTPEPTDENPDPEPVTEVVPKKAKQDLNFRFIVYEGDPIEGLDNALKMSDSDIAAVLQQNQRKYIYLPYEIKKGESEHELGLWSVDYCSTYDADAGKFKEDAGSVWEWTDGKKCSLIELNMGDYIYDLQSVKIDKHTYSADDPESKVNNLPFTNSADLKLELTAENRYQPEYINLKGEKIWDDVDDNDRYRPENINIHLLSDSEKAGQMVEVAPGSPVVVSEDEEWKWSFDHLLKKNEDGRIIKYGVTEDVGEGDEAHPIEHYTATIPDIDTTTATGDVPVKVTNKHELDKIEISGQKHWDDNDNQDGMRPKEIIVRLWDNGEEVRTATVTADDDWAYTFTDLPKMRDGEDIVYQLTEDTIDEYSTVYDTEVFDITNIHTPMKTSLTVMKVWDDNNNQDGIRPEEVTVHLLADGKDTGKTLVLNEDNNLTGSFTDLDVYRDQGHEIEYTLKEDPVEGYTTEITGDPTEGYIVTNSHEPELIEISGKKTWNDADNQDDARPASITLRLYADGQEVRTKEVTAKDNWEYTFTALPKYDHGEEVVYRMTEDGIEGYSSVYDGYNVTNHHTPGKTSVSVTKGWNDDNNRDGIRPEEITVHLLENGKDTGQTLVLNEENAFTGSFTGLDIHRDGRDLEYTVKEDPVKGYTTEITGHAKEGYSITNQHIPEQVRVRGKKTWDDANDQDEIRPEAIRIRLWANGRNVQTVKVTAEDGWKYDFRHLPKYEDGEVISYQITEDRIKGYETTYNGFSVINSHTPNKSQKTSITVTKVWSDGNDLDGIRPHKIIVHLLADGKDTGKTLTLSEENGLTGSFTDLEVDKDGKEIKYTVAEDPVEGYKTSIDGDMEKGYIITNSHLPETGTETSDKAPLRAVLAALLISGVALIILRRRRVSEARK